MTYTIAVRIVFFVVVAFRTCFCDFVVKTKSGLINGHLINSTKGVQFIAYEGVPYAQPPVGQNRYAEPKEVKPWSGVWKADFLHVCLQYDHAEKKVTGDEDCLYLNLYKPVKSSEKLLNVIVHIHGGAFMFGYGHKYGPNLLLNRDDLIFINLNYRLGVLGFTSTGDLELPGNLGLKDQTFALKWIQDNVEAFGGDPQAVTITGMSAGGASVHLHYLSPLSRGLFKNGMSLSGCALNPWVFAENVPEKTRQLASEVGCSTTNGSKVMLDCLKTRPARTLVEKTKLFMPWLYNPFSPFGLTIEPKHDNAFLTEHPYVLLRNKQMYDAPWVISFTQAEGLYPAAEFVSDKSYLPTLEKMWFEYAPFVLDYNHTIESRDEMNTISKKIKEFYMKDKPISNDTFLQLVQMIGDRLFVNDIIKAAQLHNFNSPAPVFMYYFSYRGQYSRSFGLSRNFNDYGVSHADDLLYILSTYTYPLNAKDSAMSDSMIGFWMSFAKNSNPIENSTSLIKWDSLSKSNFDNFEYLHIYDPMNISMRLDGKGDITKFWESLPFNENDKLFENVNEEL